MIALIWGFSRILSKFVSQKFLYFKVNVIIIEYMNLRGDLNEI